MVEFLELGLQVQQGSQASQEKRVCLVCLEKLGHQENLVIFLIIYELNLSE